MAKLQLLILTVMVVLLSSMSGASSNKDMVIILITAKSKQYCSIGFYRSKDQLQRYEYFDSVWF